MLPAYRYPEYYTQKGQPKGLLKSYTFQKVQRKTVIEPAGPPLPIHSFDEFDDFLPKNVH